MRGASKLRNYDVSASNIVYDYLEDVLYSKEVINFKRNEDFETQIKGVDVTFDRGGHHYIADEKASVQWANKRKLRTYSFELSFLDKKNWVHDGWLISDDEINNSFVLVWCDRFKADMLTSKDEIEEIEVAIVKRRALVDHIESLGWDRDKLVRKMELIRSNPDYEYMGNINKDGCKFSYSQQLVEKPINILLPRSKLLELSDFNRIYRQ